MSFEATVSCCHVVVSFVERSILPVALSRMFHCITPNFHGIIISRILQLNSRSRNFIPEKFVSVFIGI